MNHRRLHLVGVNGTERRRTPVAAKMAFEIAAGTTAADGSRCPRVFPADGR